MHVSQGLRRQKKSLKCFCTVLGPETAAKNVRVNPFYKCCNIEILGNIPYKIRVNCSKCYSRLFQHQN